MPYKIWLTVISFMFLIDTGGALANQSNSNALLAKCASVISPIERLKCYDEAVTETGLSVPAISTLKSGAWQVQIEKSKIDDSETVVISVQADNKINGWLKTFTPSLILRCKEGKLEAYVNTGMPPNVEYGNLNGTTTKVRFDDATAFDASTEKSTDGEALFFVSPKERIGAMLKHNKMLFQFTPFNASPTITTFNLTGLEEAIKPLKIACKWK